MTRRDFGFAVFAIVQALTSLQPSTTVGSAIQQVVAITAAVWLIVK